VFLEVARELNTKVYVGAARRKVLACLELPAEDMARLTSKYFLPFNVLEL
jgi:hypothetical protein